MWDLGSYSMIGVFVSSPTGIVIRIYIVECNYDVRMPELFPLRLSNHHELYSQSRHNT